jgi:hypothetical protein
MDRVFYLYEYFLYILYESILKVVARIFQEFSEEDKFLKYFDTTLLSNDKICKCHVALDHDFFFP